MSASFRSTLVSVVACGKGTATFTFERPPGYGYVAGQWMRLSLETAAGPQTKTFTLCSAPADPCLEITTRLSGSAYKNALDALEPGAPVAVSAPGGRFRLPDDAAQIAFLVGGVGVTPARSILRDAWLGGRVFDDALVIYGNQDESCAPFLDEFYAMVSAGVRVVPVYERPSAEWNGERGFITAELVARHVVPSDGRSFFICGPPLMVGAMERVLDELGIENRRRVIERFGAPVS